MRRSACQHLLELSNKSRYISRSLPCTKTAFHRRHSSLLSSGSPRHKESQTGFRPLQASYSPYILVVLALAGSAFLLDYFEHQNHPPARPRSPAISAPTTSHDPFFTDMPIAPGHRGNLTAEQDLKLRELWTLTLRTFGIQDPNAVNGRASLEESAAISETESLDNRKKKRRSIFSRKHDAGSSPSRHTDESEDKYGQVKEFQQIVATQSPESLREIFWSMVKADHPDALLLRFLRARKWDVDKALVMMISTMAWRGKEMHVDDDVVLHGELGALKDSKSIDASVKREGHDFLEQMRLGKSFLHGTDKEGRPLCIVRARLHHGGDQTEKSMERYTVFVIETTRLVLRPPVETAVSRNYYLAAQADL